LKTKYPSIFGLLAILMLVVSLLPMAKPETAQASPGTLYWEKLSTPTYYPTAGWILKSPSNVDRIAIGKLEDGFTFYALDIGAGAVTDNVDGLQVLYKSTDAGITWSDKISKLLYSAMDDADELYNGDKMWVWDVVVAEDNPQFVAVVTGNTDNEVPVNVWLSINGGSSWMDTKADEVIRSGTDDNGLLIGAIDISPAYAGGGGSTHDIAIGTRDDNDGDTHGTVWILSYPAALFGWADQAFEVAPNAPYDSDNDSTGGDVFAIEFSPSYPGDFCLGVVAATEDDFIDAYEENTYFCVGFHNIINNTTKWNYDIGAHFTNYPVEVKVSGSGSPEADNIVSADLELVSDWNGDDPRSRKEFISYDAPDTIGPTGEDTADVYRLDDTIVYRLNVPVPIDINDFDDKRISSIAYYGSSTSGKLLVGEDLGSQCSATVQSWISLDPLACPGVCWTPSSKPQTGGAGTDCGRDFTFGNMQVAWSPDGSRAYGATSSALIEDEYDWDDEDDYWAGMACFPKDETAFCITRNDNLTWNQLSLIDTWVAKWTDVAPAMDCSVLFAASINANDNAGEFDWDDNACAGFDSVWRTPNFDKAGTTLGSTWERVLCKATTEEACGDNQSNFAILRLAPDKTDGSVVFWAAGGNDDNETQVCYDNSTQTMQTPNKKAVMWSEDSGDLWYPIRPNLEVQDMAAESSTILYVLDIDGKVQKLTYARPNWKVGIPSDTCMGSGKSIAVLATGNVLVGPQADLGKIVYSPDSGATWQWTPVPMATTGKVHVAFDPGFIDNKTTYAADEAGSSVYRWVWGTSTTWTDLGPPGKPSSFHGLALANEGTLYAAWVEEAATYENEPVKAEVTEAVVSPDGNAETMQLNYVDQDGNLSSVTFDIPVDAPVDTEVAIALEAGDTGVRDVNNVARVTSDATDGTFDILGTGEGLDFGNYAYPATWNDDEEYEEAAAVASAVDRTLDPRRGVPKPGIEWSTLDDELADGVSFSLEPGSLKLCGCLTADTYTTLYAIDDNPYTCWVPEYKPYYGSIDKVWKGYVDELGTGAIWMYTDCLAKKGPAITELDVVGCDPVSGRNQEINLAWEQLCLADEYDIIIAKDAGFTQTVWSSFHYSGWTGGWVLEPRAIITAGNDAFECGHTYYWMVRVSGHAAGDDSVLSQWSASDSFQIKAGLPVTSPYIGPMILTPVNGATGVPIKGATFTWTSFKNTSEYHFQLSSTADMLNVLADVKVPTTAYTYDKDLSYATNYYWQVRANLPAPSDWSPVFSFMTEKAPPPPEVPPPPAPPAPPPPTPAWVWAVIGIGALLVIVTLILIVRTRRV